MRIWQEHTWRAGAGQALFFWLEVPLLRRGGVRGGVRAQRQRVSPGYVLCFWNSSPGPPVATGEGSKKKWTFFVPRRSLLLYVRDAHACALDRHRRH